MLPALRRISSVAHTNAAKFEPRVSRTGFHPLRDLVLPIPPPLTPRLLALGIDEFPAQRISSAVMEAVNLLKRSYEDGFQQRRLLLHTRLHYISDAKFASVVPATYVRLYTQTVERWTSYLLEDVAPRVLAAQTRVRQSQVNAQSRKRPFNQSAVPLLEKFFHQNAFPSRLEKVELASQCHMDYRQIHVWFQNRRRRVRKEGMMLNRRVSDTSTLEKLEDTLVGALLPETTMYDEQDIDDNSTDQNAASPPNAAPNTSFPSCNTPAHAFPSPYPPLCSYDPFPLNASQRAFDLPWMRTPCSRGTPRTQPDVSSLTASFSALSLTGEDVPSSAQDSCNRSAPQTTSRPPTLLNFVTLCPPAPLPALLNKFSCPLRENRRPLSLRLSYPIQASRAHNRHIFSLSSHCSTALPSTPSPASTKRSIPRRIPKNPPMGLRATAASCAPQKPVPRTSSSSSFASEASASGSDYDSPPHTPVLSTIPLHVPTPVISRLAEGTSDPTGVYECLADSLSLLSKPVRFRGYDDSSTFSPTVRPLESLLRLPV